MIRIITLIPCLLISLTLFGQRINEISYSSQVPPPEYLGTNVNSPFAERLPIISPDGKTLYFARKYHPKNMGAENQDDIWVSYRNHDGSWSQAKNMGEPLNNAKHNFVVATSPDGKTLYLANDYSKRNNKDGLSISRWTRNGWSFPKTLNIKNHYNRNPFVCYHVSVDQKTVLMTVERDEGFGDRDIYVTFRYSDGSWSEPRNLGGKINTRGMEASVFIAADNKTIYFSSDGHPGYGGLDVFMSRRLDDTWLNWSEPVNLGRKINKPGHDFNYTIPASGEYAYFSSDFEAQMPGMSNLYRIRLPEEVRPEPVQLITGRFIDGSTDKPVENLPEEYQIVVPYDQEKADLLSDIQGFFVAEKPDPNISAEIEDLDYDGDDPNLMPVPERQPEENPELKKKQEELRQLQERLASLEQEIDEKENEPEPVADYAPVDIPRERESNYNPRLSSLEQKYASLWGDEPIAMADDQPVYRHPKKKKEKVQRGPNTRENLYSSLFEPDPVPVEPERSEPAYTDNPAIADQPATAPPQKPERKSSPILDEKQRKYAELFGEPVERQSEPEVVESQPQIEEQKVDTPAEPVTREQEVADIPETPEMPAYPEIDEAPGQISELTTPDAPQFNETRDQPSFEELEQKVRQELEEEMRDEIRRQLEQDLRPDVKDDIAEEIRDDVRKDLEDEVRDDVRKDVEDQIRDDVRKNVEDQLRKDLKSEVEDDLASDLRPEIENQLKEDLREDVRKELENEMKDDLRDDVKKQLEDQMRADVEQELKDALRDEMAEDLRNQLRREMEQELKREEQRLRREIENNIRKQMRERERDIASNNTFPTSDPEEPVYRELENDVVLYPIKVGQIIPMDNIYFDANKTTLKEASFIELQKVLDFLNNNKNLVVEISGHTNGLCSTSFAEELSDGRSKIVTEYLIEHGIPGDRLSYRGYGKTKPIATNNTLEGRKKNQRVEMKILEILSE
ncbi:MAG: OmpA family protein [Bacteroidota bacterium]